MINREMAERLARNALDCWYPNRGKATLAVTELTSGWRFELADVHPGRLGGAHPAISRTGRVLRIPNGLPDDVVDELIIRADARPDDLL